MSRTTNFDIEQEIKEIKKLRKCSELEKIDILEWTKEELVDLLKNYTIYMENHQAYIPVEEFIRKGHYQNMSTKEIEELKRYH